MVLAAGLGTRLRPLTERVPKALVPAAGSPMIHYPLKWLKAQGFDEVIVNTHYLADELEAGLGDGSALGIKIAYSREIELLGTGGGVGRARKFFGNSRLVLINADTLLSADLAAMMERHVSSGAVATMALSRPAAGDDYTPVMVDAAGMVRRIGGRPESAGEGQGGLDAYHFTGLSILEPALVDYLPADRFAHLAADGLVPAIADGKKVAAWPYSGYWKVLDNAERISEAEADMEAGRFVAAREKDKSN